jgi:hypothetical protein
LRLHTAADGPPGKRVEELRRLVEEYTGEARSVWADFNWDGRTNVEAALKEQQRISKLVREGRLVVKTSVMEEELDEWPGAPPRKAQVMHTGTIWTLRVGPFLEPRAAAAGAVRRLP